MANSGGGGGVATRGSRDGPSIVQSSLYELVGAESCGKSVCKLMLIGGRIKPNDHADESCVHLSGRAGVRRVVANGVKDSSACHVQCKRGGGSARSGGGDGR